MENEHSYPARVNSLLDEIKFKKNKIKELEDRLKAEEKTTIIIRSQNIELQKDLRELKSGLLKYGVDGDKLLTYSTIPDSQGDISVITDRRNTK